MPDACSRATADGCPRRRTAADADPPTNPSRRRRRPTPTPTPTAPTPALQIFLKVDVTKAKAAKVRISVSRTAKVSLKVERKSGRKWKRVTATQVASRRPMSVQEPHRCARARGKKFAKGSYRVTATVGGRSRR